MPLIVLLLMAVVAYTTYTVLMVFVGSKMNPYLAATIFNAIATLIAFGFVLFSKFVNKQQIVTTESGIFYSVLAGFAIGAVSILVIKILGRGNIAYANPVIFGGLIACSALAGLFLFKEHVSLLQGAGILVTISGIGMVVVSKLY